MFYFATAADETMTGGSVLFLKQVQDPLNSFELSVRFVIFKSSPVSESLSEKELQCYSCFSPEGVSATTQSFSREEAKSERETETGDETRVEDTEKVRETETGAVKSFS